MENNYTRKSFLKNLGLTTAGALSLPLIGSKSANNNIEYLSSEVDQNKYAVNDQINIALIGAGIMGQNNGIAALQNNGIKMVAACDLYESRNERSKELWGDDVFTTKDYREILLRDDVDSVIIATTDHWHKQIVIDSLRAGKAVYCEKPIVQHIEEGFDIIETQKETGGLIQIGSQSTSSVLNAKARELYLDGAIGELNFVESSWDRQSFSGAWNYSMPPSAGSHNIDWDTYLKDLPKIPFDPEKFFRWRKYQDFAQEWQVIYMYTTFRHFILSPVQWALKEYMVRVESGSGMTVEMFLT